MKFITRSLRRYLSYHPHYRDAQTATPDTARDRAAAASPNISAQPSASSDVFPPHPAAGLPPARPPLAAPEESVPREMLEHSAEQTVRELRFQTWLDDVIEQHRRDGGFANLAGQGKPLPLDDPAFSGDGMVYGILKNARVLPEWLELQHEIRETLRRLVELRPMLNESEVARRTAALNEKILRHNECAPSDLLKKPPLHSSRSFAEQLANWE